MSNTFYLVAVSVAVAVAYFIYAKFIKQQPVQKQQTTEKPKEQKELTD
jgi:carbon starvation protein CstA